MPLIGFGVNSKLRLPEQLAVVACGEPAGPALDDPQLATRAALTDPLGYPPLRQSVVAGDRVVLALGEGLMQPSALVAGAVWELLDAGIEAEAITVIRTAADAKLVRESPTQGLPPELRDRLQVLVHDPTDREMLCMLNVSSADDAIYLNRAIVEADVVIPFGVARLSQSLGYHGVHGVLFPAFADAATQQRFLAPRSSLSGKQRKQRIAEAREADWFLGTRMIVQVVPGQGENVLQVLAGDVDAVEKRSGELCEAIWQVQVPRRAKIVIATLPGGRQQQTWSNFARVLDAALRVVEDDGTIAVCCDLRTRPGPSLRRLAKATSLDAASRAIERDQTPDALTAAQLIRTLRRVQVYLLSRLNEEAVHALGLAYVSKPDEVARLATRHESCLVLQNAHQAIPIVTEEILS